MSFVFLDVLEWDSSWHCFLSYHKSKAEKLVILDGCILKYYPPHRLVLDTALPLDDEWPSANSQVREQQDKVS